MNMLEVLEVLEAQEAQEALEALEALEVLPAQELYLVFALSYLETLLRANLVRA